MNTITILSENIKETKKFLNLYYSQNIDLENNFYWEKHFENPVDMIELISTYVDNNDKFSGNIWISLDKDIYICVTDYNLDYVIKYLFERYPY